MDLKATPASGGVIPGRADRPVRWLALPVLALCAAACVFVWSTGDAPRPPGGYERFIPDVPTAQHALETALAAWQEGRRPGLLAAEPVPVVAVDAEWARGERLQSFSVVGESSAGGPRSFVVRLKLDGRGAESTARFVVMGIDPLWVYRHEDLEMMEHMHHPPGDAAAPAKTN